ncbi:MAG: hypothetical protein HS122_13110 [Opitutaceae bacterium]|nr:hypothetical protein [Opitutaceae bacterium]
MAIYLNDLIGRIPPTVESRVKRVRDQTRSVIQEALRTECRLHMRTPEDAANNRPGAQVPVEVSPGYPAILQAVQFPDDFELILLLSRYRATLEQAKSGTAGLRKLRDDLLHIHQGERWVDVESSTLVAVEAWSDKLLTLLHQNDPLDKLLAIRGDFLGLYEFDTGDYWVEDHHVNRASIKLYWGVIGLAAQWLGCEVEDLTIVVLTHELAHAYTQLGADIESRRWAAPVFARTDAGVVEGLAQYYTDRVLRRLEKRFPEAFKAYETMLPRQPEEYRTHEKWVREYSPEAVRRAMLEVRRWRELSLTNFNRRLIEAHHELHPADV